MSESFEIIVQDETKTITVDQLATHLYGIPIEVVEVKFIDSETGLFSVMVSNSHEQSRLKKLGIIEISDCILTIHAGETLEEPVFCPHCKSDITGLPDEEKSFHTITCEENFLETLTNFDGPFAITCPYPQCGRRVEARNFPAHAFQTHASHVQNLACPICHLLGDKNYQVKTDTNLINHLQSSHSDLIGVDVPVPSTPKPKPKPKPVNRPVEYPADQPSDYIVHIPSIDSVDECPICYDILCKGVKVARLPCFCVYHQKCIEAWFTQKSARKCPLHGMDKT